MAMPLQQPKSLAHAEWLFTLHCMELNSRSKGVIDMPLKKGKSNKVVGANIKELESTGRSRNQSIAIALSVAGKSKPKKRK